MTHEHRLHTGKLEEFKKWYHELDDRDDMPEYRMDAAQLAWSFGRAPADAALADISARKAVLIEAYGFTEQTETEGATEIGEKWEGAIQRGYGEWCVLLALEDILKGE